ncbi:hypothetical protein LPJ53_003948 [Coemansia erecta]|uniref:Anaphase-promoting complex subunit 10 n=1 Tax=Coemansia erecta TaxID=147472 RepID=A0A9W7Y0Y2_9FUNG|nr:hypothetical protein LPJ53_003948 [Coemansia erecta]
MDRLPDISRLAHWSASTTKQGFGVTNLLDGSPDTFWQSDGHQPHTLTLRFAKRQPIHAISLFLDYARDESYTPCRIRLLAGSNPHDLQLLLDHVLETPPNGWVLLPLADAAGEKDGGGALHAHFLCIELPANYESGRDVHVRMARVLAPPPRDAAFRRDRVLPFSTPDFSMYDSIR